MMMIIYLKSDIISDQTKKEGVKGDVDEEVRGGASGDS